MLRSMDLSDFYLDLVLHSIFAKKPCGKRVVIL